LGSTSTGLIKGVQSVAIFVVSHFAFCSVQQSQCFSMIKGVSLLIVLLGVYIYTQYQPAQDGGDHRPGASMKLAHTGLRLNAYLPIYDRIPGDADDRPCSARSEYVSLVELSEVVKEAQRESGAELTALPSSLRRVSKGSNSVSPTPSVAMKEEGEEKEEVSSYQHGGDA
jgi:hypothetical protein